MGAEWQKLLKGEKLAFRAAPKISWGSVPSLEDLNFGHDDVEEARSCRQRSAVPWAGGESALTVLKGRFRSLGVALARLQQYIWDRRALKQCLERL